MSRDEKLDFDQFRDQIIALLLQARYETPITAAAIAATLGLVLDEWKELPRFRRYVKSKIIKTAPEGSDLSKVESLNMGFFLPIFRQEFEKVAERRRLSAIAFGKSAARNLKHGKNAPLKTDDQVTIYELLEGQA